MKTGTNLDYEKKNSYMVTVTATDPSLASATIDVTINVVNVNEGPVIAGEDDIAKEHPENSTGTIQRFQATDPERRPVYWSLKDADSDYPDDDFFTISKNGVLSFMEGRDFENPQGGGDNNTYKVVVIASDDAPRRGYAHHDLREEVHRPGHQRERVWERHRGPESIPRWVFR